MKDFSTFSDKKKTKYKCIEQSAFVDHFTWIKEYKILRNEQENKSYNIMVYTGWMTIVKFYLKVP